MSKLLSKHNYLIINIIFPKYQFEIFEPPYVLDQCWFTCLHFDSAHIFYWQNKFLRHVFMCTLATIRAAMVTKSMEHILNTTPLLLAAGALQESSLYRTLETGLPNTMVTRDLPVSCSKQSAWQCREETLQASGAQSQTLKHYLNCTTCKFSCLLLLSNSLYWPVPMYC